MSLLGKALGAGLKHFTGLSISKKQQRSVRTSTPEQGHPCPPGTRCDGISTDGLCVGACVPIAGGGLTAMAGMGAACPTGYRLNKSTYVTRGGGTSRWPAGALLVHPKHSTCVKRRRRNVGNAKALRSAISRVKGFVKLARKAHALVGGHHTKKQVSRGTGVEIVRAG
jgi:hypothetical protein